MNRYQYLCDTCDHVAETRALLLQHTAYHHAAEVFRCPVCPFITQYQANLRRHKRTIHGIQAGMSSQVLEKQVGVKKKVQQKNSAQMSQEIGFCDKQISSSQLAAHIGKTFKNSSTTNSQSMVKSNEKYGKKSTKPFPSEGYLRVRRVYRCQQCDLVTINPRKFLYHCQEVHMERITVYECPYCLYASKNFQKLQRHCGMVHKKMLVKDTNLNQVKHNTPGGQKAVKGIHTSRKKLTNAESCSTSVRKSAVKPNNLLVSHAFTQESKEQKNISLGYADVEAGSTVNTKKQKDQRKDSEYVKSNLKTKNTSHLKKKFFRCLKCSYVTSERAKYTRHCKFHTMPKIKCKFCDFQTTYKWNLDRHVKNHGLEGTFKCKTCSFTSHTKQSLLVHQCKQEDCQYNEQVKNTSRSVSKDFSPRNDDDEIFENSSKATFNYETVKSNVVQKRFKCRFCNFTACPSRIKRHERGHLTKKKYSCPTCGLGFDLLPYLTRHMKREHGTTEQAAKSIVQKLKRKNGTGKAVPTCTVCGYKPKWVSELEKHFRVHSGQKPFSCYYCHYQTKWKGDLTRHLQKYHPNKPQMSFLRHKHGQEIRIKALKHYEPVMSSYLPSGNEENKTTGTMNTKTKTVKKKMSQFSKHENKHLQFLNLSDNQKLPLDLSVANKTMLFKEEYGDLSSTGVSICKDAVCDVLPKLELQKTKLKTINANGQGDSTRSSFKERKFIKKYSCDQCSFETHLDSKFHTHYVKHHDMQEFICSACGHKSNDQKEITEHIKIKFADDSLHQYATCLLSCDTGNIDCQKYLKSVLDVPVNDIVRDLDGHESSDLEKPAKAIICGIENETVEQKPSSLSLKNWAESSESGNVIFEVDFRGIQSKNETKLYRCNLCSFNHCDMKVVVSHMAVHAGIKPYRCRICKFTSNWRNLILKHIKSKHGGNVQDLEECFSVKLKNHVLYLTGISTENKQNVKKDCYPLEYFRCNICPYTCEKQFYIKTHLKQHQPRKEAVFKCLHCPYYVKYRKTLVRHMKLHEEHSSDGSERKLPHYAEDKIEDLKDISVNFVNEDENESCNIICEDNMGTEKSVDNVGNKKPVKDSVATGNLSSNPTFTSTALFKKFMCSQCPYRSDNRKQFLHHKQFHRPNRVAPHRCTVCSYWATRLHLLKQHMKLHTVGTKLVEREEETPNMEGIEGGIPFELTTKGNFLVKTYKCCYCPMRNRRRVNVRLHMSMHNRSTVSKFSCPLCNYQCNNQGVLGVHLKLHQESEVDAFLKNTIGTEALKHCVHDEFNRDSSQKKEIPETKTKELNMLSGQRLLSPCNQKINFSYFCMNCPAMFKSIGGLKTHQSFHGVNHSFHCPCCDYTARHKPHLHKHLLVHTPAYAAKRKASNAPPLNVSDNTHNLSDTNGQISDKNELSEITIKESTINNQMLLLEEAETQSYLQGLCQKISQKLLGCPICPAKFVKQTTFNFHLGLHGGPGPYKCTNCNYTVATACNLLSHTPLHSQSGKIQNIPKKNVYQCPKCPAVFSKHSRYDRHVNLHGKKSRFTCNKCDYSVRCAANLHKHRNVHEKIQSHSPLVVQESFISPALPFVKQAQETCRKETAESPMDVVDKENLKCIFRCDRCPYTNECKDAVQIHQKQHSAQEGVTCPHCDYTTVQTSGLLDHINSHFQLQDFLMVKAFMEPLVELWSVENENKEQIFICPDTSSIQHKNFTNPLENNYVEVNKDNFFLTSASGIKHSKEEFLLHLNVVEKRDVSIKTKEDKILACTSKVINHDLEYDKTENITDFQLDKQNTYQETASGICSTSSEQFNMEICNKSQDQHGAIFHTLSADVEAPLATENNALSKDSIARTVENSEIFKFHRVDCTSEYSMEKTSKRDKSLENDTTFEEFTLEEPECSKFIHKSSTPLINTEISKNLTTDELFVSKKSQKEGSSVLEPITTNKEQNTENSAVNFHDYESNEENLLENSVTDIQNAEDLKTAVIVLDPTNSSQLINDVLHNNDILQPIIKENQDDRLEICGQVSSVIDHKEDEKVECFSFIDLESKSAGTKIINDSSCISTEVPLEDFTERPLAQCEILRNKVECTANITLEELMCTSHSDVICTDTYKLEEQKETITLHTDIVNEFSPDDTVQKNLSEPSSTISELNGSVNSTDFPFSTANEKDLFVDDLTDNFIFQDCKAETENQVSDAEKNKSFFEDVSSSDSVHIVSHNFEDIQTHDNIDISPVLETGSKENENAFFQTSMNSNSQYFDVTSVDDNQTNDIVIGSNVFYSWDMDLSDDSHVGAYVSVGDSREDNLCPLAPDYDLCTSSEVVCLTQDEIGLHESLMN